MLSIRDYEKKIQDEIQRVKNLKGKLPPWYINDRPKNEFWEEDTIDKLPGVGSKVAASLKAIDIALISDLGLISEVDLQDVESMTKDPNLTEQKLRGLLNTVRQSKKGSCPYQVRDLRKEDNPYYARYGENWRDEMKKVQFMQPYVCVTDLINHMVSATNQVMKGTKYEGKGLFFHDALSLITAKETVRWMKENDLYKYWIIPELGCNDVVGNNKNCYASRPVGNSPELMCLDMSLNKDVRESFRMHVSITQHLDSSHCQRFSGSSPNQIVSSIFRLTKPDETGVVPTSKRIMEDIDRLDYAMKEIMNAKGAIVPGLCERNGDRKHVDTEDRRGYYNNLAKKKVYNIHVDAQEVAEDTKDDIKLLFDI